MVTVGVSLLATSLLAAAIGSPYSPILGDGKSTIPTNERNQPSKIRTIVTMSGQSLNNINVVDRNISHSSSNDHQQKRALTRSHPAKICPAGTDFLESMCTAFYYRDVRQYQTRCVNQITHELMYHRGHCASNQYCMDSWGDLGHPPPTFADVHRPQAWCVGQENFIRLALQQVGTDKHIDALHVGLPLGGKGASQYALEAILTSPDGQGAEKASKMTLQAMRSRNVHGRLLDVPFENGSIECSNCERVFVDPVPEGTTVISLDVVTKAGTFDGNVLMGSWSL
jgi:hypothetical protein